MLLATDIAMVDHTDGTVTLIANAINFDDSPARVDEAWTDAVSRLDEMTRALAEAPSVTVAALSGDVTVEVAERTRAALTWPASRRPREHIRAGDAFQIVLSQRFSAPRPADATDVPCLGHQPEPATCSHPAAGHGTRRGPSRTSGAGTWWARRPRRWSP